MDLNSHIGLWQQTANRKIASKPKRSSNPTRTITFSDAAWQEHPVSTHQAVLPADVEVVIDTVRETDGMEDETARKAEFYTRQFVDAMAPTNFALTNPQVLQETIDTQGQNLVNGLSNLLEDLERGKGQLAIKHVEPDAFEIGKTVATTPGKVVFQNELFQLLQFAPSTDKVRKRLDRSPWINSILYPRSAGEELVHQVGG